MARKSLVTLIILFASVSILYGQNPDSHLLVGTSTNTGESKGIYVYEFNPITGKMSYKSMVAVGNPSYLTVSSNRKYVYAVSEEKTGYINAFTYNSISGVLKSINRQSSGGAGPTYVSSDATGKYVFAANYGGGSLSAIPVEKDGSLGADIQVIKHEGSSINKMRQTKPYVHSVVISPDNHFLLAQDLGTDKVYIYQFDPKQRPSPLTPAAQPFISIAPGSGPRHLTFHPNNKYAYLINEVNSTITAFRYKEGHLTLLQTVSVLPPGYSGIGDGADIHISPDGKYLYGSDRNVLNELIIYSINKNNGKLTFVGRQSTLGKDSRTFAIDPSGNFLIVANGGTNDITIFKRNKKTGLLIPTGQKINIFKPDCVKFVKIY
ncbi:MAG TPA: lactonase family protein [Hanamia sp.]|nr:lactonase family protein [Hanamia sp.]